MTLPNNMAFHLTSTPSETHAESYKYEDTPNTCLTNMSPLQDSTKSSRLLNALSLSTGGMAPEFRYSSYGDYQLNNSAFRSPKHTASVDSICSAVQPDKDPFVTSTPKKAQSQRQSKLSATASAFTPLRAVLDTPVVAHGVSTDHLTTPKVMPPAATASISPTTGRRTFLDTPLSSTIGRNQRLTRSLRVISFSGVISDKTVEDYLKRLQAIALGSPFESRPVLYPVVDAVYLRFENIRDAELTLKDKNVKPQDWKIEAVSAYEINKVTDVNVLATDIEGLHTLLVHPITQMSECAIEDKVREHFKHYDVFALAKQQTSPVPGTMCWVMEFADVDVSWGYAAEQYNRGWMNVDGMFQIALGPYPAGLAPSMRTYSLSNPQLPALPSTAPKDLTARFDELSLYGTHGVQIPAAVNTPKHPTHYPWGPGGVVSGSPTYAARVYDSVMGRGPTPVSSSGSFALSPMTPTFPMNSIYSPPRSISHSNNASPRFQRVNSHRNNAARVNRSQFSPPGPHHNHVDINKIREGVDVRTTIMLRNIPNKVDQAMLKGIIDESSWGKYDFMYLRIDFANDCNVGYAFINFVDPLDIIDFVNARANQRWNCFKSDKIAEVSYATIQGKDCLVQKFRNSSVMLEAPHYRPKLYYTTNGPTPELAGSEEPFPEPDNQSKMKRSCENAEHVGKFNKYAKGKLQGPRHLANTGQGLFTPHAGQHFRDEQRRRRSQFDRGTRLAALEECGGIYTLQDVMH